MGPEYIVPTIEKAHGARLLTVESPGPYESIAVPCRSDHELHVYSSSTTVADARQNELLLSCTSYNVQSVRLQKL